jgi:hypothetical protein
MFITDFMDNHHSILPVHKFQLLCYSFHAVQMTGMKQSEGSV